MEVKLHEYKEGTPNQRRYFIELWDVGGSQSHENTRSVFYNPTNGMNIFHAIRFDYVHIFQMSFSIPNYDRM